MGKMTLKERLFGGAKEENVNTPVTLGEKFAYACGDFGCNMSFFLNSYILIYCVDFLKIPAPVFSLVLVFLKIWDAINDPIIGGLMDGIKHKPGVSKFKPWIFVGAFLLLGAGCLVFCFPVPSAPTWLKMLIVGVGYLAWDISYTVVNVPYGSMNAAITSDPAERASLSAFRSLGATFANIITGLTIPYLIYKTVIDPDNGKKASILRGDMMIWIGIAGGLLGFIALMILLLGTKERVIVKHDKEPQEDKTENLDNKKSKKDEKFNYGKSLGGFFKNYPAVILTVISMIQLVVVLGFQSAISTLYMKNAIPEIMPYSGVITVISYIPTLALAPFIKKLVKKFGKKELSAWSLLLAIGAALVYLFIPVEKIADSSEIIAACIIVGINFFIGLGSVSLNLVTWAMVADCIDNQELKTGIRAEGVVYATYSLGRKIAQGIALAVASILPLLGYNADLIEQTMQTQTNFRLVLSSAYIGGFAIIFLLLIFAYPLSKKKVYELEAKLHRSNTELLGQTGEDD